MLFITKTIIMKKLLLVGTFAFLATNLFAQLDLPPSGGNPKASITEEVGITSITINYSRPDVNKREGKVWGDGNIVTYGFSTTNFTTNKNNSHRDDNPRAEYPADDHLHVFIFKIVHGS